jgi:hypothetical protein
MRSKVRVFLILLVVVASTAVTLITCKPITYYLQQVYKAYGKVTEAGTGTPLESVEVFLDTYQYSVLTNGLGDYGIELSEGTWKLKFVKADYDTVEKVVTVNAAKPRAEVDVQLTPTAPPPPPPYYGPTAYAGTDGGLSILTNGGTSWTNYTTANGLGSNMVFGGVYASGSTIYAATFGGGLSISTNGGASWTNYTTANGLASDEIHGLFVKGSTIYVATYGNGLSVSTNGGTSWRT